MIRSLLLAAAVLAAFAVPASAASVTQLSGSAGCFEMHGKQGCARGVGTEWTTAAVASPDGKNVYATSGIGSFGAVLSFKRDRKTGALKQLKGKRGCISSTGRAQQNLSSKKPCAKAPGLPQANDIAIAPDGLTVYTLAQAGFDDGQAVDVWRRDPATGRLAQVQCLTANAGNPGCTQVALDLPTKFALSGDGHRLIAAGSALTSFDVNGDGTLSNAVCQYKLEAQPGNLCDPAPRLEGVRVATEITASPEFTKLYLAGGQGGKGQISALNVDPGTGVISFDSCVGDPAGTLTSCNPARGIDSPGDLAVSPDASGLYAAAWNFHIVNEENGSGKTRTSAIAAFTGALEQLAGSDGCTLFFGTANEGCATRPSGSGLDGANAIAVSPNGKYALAGFWDSHAVALLKRNASTQALTPVSGKTACVSDFAKRKRKRVKGCAAGHGINNPEDVAFSANGRNAYVPTVGGMSVFRVK